jgi:hypothetical protein
MSLIREDNCFPFHGGTLLAIFSGMLTKAPMLNLESLRGIPMYFMGRDPTVQFSMLAILQLSFSSIQKIGFTLVKVDLQFKHPLKIIEYKFYVYYRIVIPCTIKIMSSVY